MTLKLILHGQLLLYSEVKESTRSYIVYDPQQWRLGLTGLEDIQAAVERALELSEAGDGGDAFVQWSYNVISAVTPSGLDNQLLSLAHHDFRHHRGLMEVTLRQDKIGFEFILLDRHECYVKFSLIDLQEFRIS